MRSCCGSILSQRVRVQEAQEKLQEALERANGESTIIKAHTVSEVLNQIREILGGYSVSKDLTFLFRQQLEPDLANVWTLADLEDYSHRLEAFAKRLDDSLRRWQAKYCKERK